VKDQGKQEAGDRMLFAVFFLPNFPNDTEDGGHVFL
jgi:hypothetical protein